MSVVGNVACRAHAVGISVIPPTQDGTKQPGVSRWGTYQKTRPSTGLLRRWYDQQGRSGLGYVCGAISGNLEAMETDATGIAEAFIARAYEVGLGELIDRIRAGYEDATPGGGRHWLYRCAEIRGNTPLARRVDDDGVIHVLIETRGEGGYIIAAPSNGAVHPSGGTYRQLQGSVETIATITPQERRDLWALARTFDEMPHEEPREAPSSTAPRGDRPGDIFNARATWREVLEPHGWVHVFTRGEEGYWRRPGKDRGISATTNYRGSDLLKPFTTSTDFDSERTYSKFAAYCQLEHSGDFTVAARSLAAEGYVAEKPAASTFTVNGKPATPDDGGDGPKATDEVKRFPRTDTGNAERLVARHGHDIRFNNSRKVWQVWTGSHWGEDLRGLMEQRAKETARTIPEEAKGLSDDAYAKILKWAAESESAGRRAAMIKLAQSEPGVGVFADDLDANPWLLSVANGTLDLRTGVLRDHDRADLITRCLRTRYDPGTSCPIFSAFLSRIFGDDDGLIAYVQRMIGYALTGSIREQAIFIAYGGGANGKTTLLGAISALLEGYATEADSDSFLELKGDKIREDVAALDGARFVAASETADGRRLSEAFVKKATGGEKLRARRLYENGYTFTPQCKVWLCTNHRPVIRGTDHAIWRRIRLLPFTVTIPANERDLDLPAKLQAEFPGILAWAVDGCRQWLEHGERPPKSVLQATEQYRLDMDALANWLTDRCEVRANRRELFGALFADCVAYCQEADEEPLSKKTFGDRLTDRGIAAKRDGSARYRAGIRLKDPTTPEQTGLDENTVDACDACDPCDASSGNFPQGTLHEDFTGKSVTCVTSVTSDQEASCSLCGAVLSAGLKYLCAACQSSAEDQE